MITFVFPIAYINQLRKYNKTKNIYKNKKQETRTKGKEKDCFFWKLIHFSSFRLKHLGV